MKAEFLERNWYLDWQCWLAREVSEWPEKIIFCCFNQILAFLMQQFMQLTGCILSAVLREL